MLRLLLLSAVLALPACATHVPLYVTGQAALGFWSIAVEGDSRQRETLWDQAQADGDRWQMAMLQSLPDWSRYDPSAARSGLGAALNERLPADRAALAHIRLQELQQASACRGEVKKLQARLTRIVDIEREMDDGR